uniref:Uncharacterized protein n=2 Tax=Oryza TaxID=4527 RepID=A0A0D3HFV0_9ORYZ
METELDTSLSASGMTLLTAWVSYRANLASSRPLTPGIFSDRLLERPMTKGGENFGAFWSTRTWVGDLLRL